MEPAWLKKKKEIPSVVTSLYNDARIAGAWIYYVPKRQFYTPKEFIENWESVFYQSPRGKNNRADFQIMNPMAAIRQRAEWVAKASAELQEIMRKLEQYHAEFKAK
ncbi:hypothetical protein [Sphingobacterium thalpophilum]|uniref:hypothetical protein n=1 Tax=Sphingobacterium thalpophilum TaxID=259 RepID=UPI003D980CA0